jgi:N-acetylglutamate synthase-like GNAT family acetyltransferase|tara:strand:- start:446 stop:889 length:444 start_codon:yes stop_codon:yes gene_type:complete
MTSVHFYQAEKKDFQNVYDLLIEFKEVELADLKLPNEDKTKLTQFINSILEKGKIILVKDLDKDEFMGCCMFHKSEYWFSKDQIMNIHIIYIKKKFRNFKLVKTLIDSVKKVSEGMPIVLSITTGLQIDPVFEKLGFENMGSNWRLC